MLVQSRAMLRTAMRSWGVGRLLSSVLTSNQEVLAPPSQPPVYMPTNIEKTGTFMKQLPEIYAADIYFKRAMKTTRDIKLDPEIKNIRNAHRKQAAMVMDALMKGLTVPLTQVIDTYKKGMKSMHPYELTVMNLTVIARAKTGHPHLQDILADLKELRAATSRIAKDHAGRAKLALSAVEAKDCMVDGVKQLQNLYNTSSKALALAELGDLQKTLRRIPVIELSTPTVVLVGAPNVGKSSIVRAVSTGTPEVNDYPFTTRGVTVGHIVDKNAGTRYQVMDTPGLLDRPEELRNEMERLTFASMQHLPTAVVFVIDPSGLSGDQSTLEAQLNVRAYLKQRFPKRPWVDVVSKADLPLSREVTARLPEGHLRVSVKDGTNLGVLQDKLGGMFEVLREVMASRAASSSSAGSMAGAGAGAGTRAGAGAGAGAVAGQSCGSGDSDRADMSR